MKSYFFFGCLCIRCLTKMPTFSLKCYSFVLTFRSLIHIVLFVMRQMGPIHSFAKNQPITNVWVYFWIFYSSSLIPVFILMPGSLLFIVNFVVSFEIRKLESSNFCVQACFGYSESPALLYEFYITLSISVKKLVCQCYCCFWFCFFSVLPKVEFSACRENRAREWVLACLVCAHTTVALLKMAPAATCAWALARFFSYLSYLASCQVLAGGSSPCPWKA